MRWTPERTRINTRSLSSVRGLVGDAVVETNLAVGRALPLEEAIAEALAEAPIAAAAPGVTNASDEDQLTGREREVLALLVRGLTSKEICRRLGSECADGRTSSRPDISQGRRTRAIGPGGICETARFGHLIGSFYGCPRLARHLL
jgi:hypothetical protein